jgi:hypothetical protein
MHKKKDTAQDCKNHHTQEHHPQLDRKVSWKFGPIRQPDFHGRKGKLNVFDLTNP